MLDIKITFDIIYIVVIDFYSTINVKNDMERKIYIYFDSSLQLYYTTFYSVITRKLNF